MSYDTNSGRRRPRSGTGPTPSFPSVSHTWRTGTARGAVPAAAAPATVWAPPAHAVRSGWCDWVHAAIRAAFLPPAGSWWDMTPSLNSLTGQPGCPGTAEALTPVPFWAALITDPAPPATPDTSGPPVDAVSGPRHQSGHATARSQQVTGVLAPVAPSGSVDVAFADLTADPTADLVADPNVVDGRFVVFAAQALSAGGILAVLTRCRPGRDGRLVDPSGAIVAAAQNADLLYLQHIVIPAGPLRLPPSRRHDDRTAVRDEDVEGAGGGGIGGNVDLLVFAQPRAYGLHTRPTGDPTPTAMTGDSVAGDTITADAANITDDDASDTAGRIGAAR